MVVRVTPPPDPRMVIVWDPNGAFVPTENVTVRLSSPRFQFQLETLAVTPLGSPVILKLTCVLVPAVRRPRTVVETESPRPTVPEVRLVETE